MAKTLEDVGGIGGGAILREFLAVGHGDDGTNIGGGASSVTLTDVTLTNAQVKSLIAPVSLVTAAAGFVAAPISLGIVLNNSGGGYTDPDGIFKGLSVGYPGVVDGSGARVTSKELANFDIDDGSLAGMGTGIFPSLQMFPAPGASPAFGWSTATLAWTTGPIVLQKVGLANYTGGHVSNALKLRLAWVAIPTA